MATTNDIFTFMSSVGDEMGLVISKIISILSGLPQSKVIGILLFSLTAFLAFKMMKEAIKWIVIILLLFLAVSLGVSIFT